MSPAVAGQKGGADSGDGAHDVFIGGIAKGGGELNAVLHHQVFHFVEAAAADHSYPDWFHFISPSFWFE
jgi:hypothetical protein